jgi:hypothetical protein
MCVLGVSILPLSTIFIFDFGTVATRLYYYYLFFFILLLHFDWIYILSLQYLNLYTQPKTKKTDTFTPPWNFRDLNCLTTWPQEDELYSKRYYFCLRDTAKLLEDGTSHINRNERFCHAIFGIRITCMLFIALWCYLKHVIHVSNDIIMTLFVWIVKEFAIIV